MRRLIVLACVLGAAAWVAPAAFSWYSDVAASMDCGGTVTWTATAWPGPTPDSRVNPDVRVWASYDGGTSYTQVGAGAFDAANDYSFSGSFSAGSAASVLLKVHEEADWPGDGGDAPGEPHYATATRPSGCSTNTSSTPPAQPSVPQAPGRAGYCDENGKFWDLIAGQNTQPPYDTMHLRPADVDQKTGAVYCATPAPDVVAQVAPATPVIAATPPTKVTKPHVTRRKHIVKHKHVKKHKHRHPIGAVAAGRGKTLPFTP